MLDLPILIFNLFIYIYCPVTGFYMLLTLSSDITISMFAADRRKVK